MNFQVTTGLSMARFLIFLQGWGGEPTGSAGLAYRFSRIAGAGKARAGSASPSGGFLQRGRGFKIHILHTSAHFARGKGEKNPEKYLQHSLHPFVRLWCMEQGDIQNEVKS